jgi:phenylpropionate dioxygenase-like ring-hydroxylating dioxygenase large terminal subunit
METERPYNYQVTGARPGVTRFPRYDAAVLGFDEYWYPVMFADRLRNKPVALMLFGEQVMFFRDGGTAYAMLDRCPHRGIALSLGKQEFPGTFSCRYHGWTFDLKSGELVAALTDGPESPVCGKARVQKFHVAERAGIIWIFKGHGPPPPVEAHIPEEMLPSNVVIEGRVTERAGDWRYAAENGYDDGHAKYLHRDSLFLRFRRVPGWGAADIIAEDDGWITRKGKKVEFQENYPGLGVWPPQPPWRSPRKGPTASIRLPCCLRIHYGKWIHFEWYVPSEPGRHRYLQFAVKQASGLEALMFRLRYKLYLSWIFHKLFNDQDADVVESMKTPPEQLYRPDNSLIGWRKLCEKYGGIDTGMLRSTQEAADVLPAEMEPRTR